jgi:hypothetical protein
MQSVPNWITDWRKSNDKNNHALIRLLEQSCDYLQIIVRMREMSWNVMVIVSDCLVKVNEKLLTALVILDLFSHATPIPSPNDHMTVVYKYASREFFFVTNQAGVNPPSVVR